MFTTRFHNNWQQQFYKSTMIFPGSDTQVETPKMEIHH